jgi:tetratricopeptide (TPR) repeat protein
VTSHGEPRSCPSPEVLHRFIEGTLQRATARDVARHIETCRDCRFIVGEVMEFLREDGESLTEDSSEPSSSGRGWRLALAAAAIIGLAILWLFTQTDPGRRFDRALAKTPVRPVEGRLSGVPYAKYWANRSEGERAVPARLEALAQQVLAETPEHDARDWHRQGMAALMAGDSLAAIRAFERATQLDMRNALYWSDLSAARIALGMKPSDAVILAAATRDAQRALRLAPDLAAPRFNLALSLERRLLFNEARLAYLQYLAADPDSRWAGEARERTEKLQR